MSGRRLIVGLLARRTDAAAPLAHAVQRAVGALAARGGHPGTAALPPEVAVAAGAAVAS